MTRHLVAALSMALATTAAAQRSPDFRWEKAFASGRDVSLHNVAGNVTVKASTSGKVEVLGYKHGRGDMSRLHAEVRETSRGLVVCVVDDDTDWTCDERGMSSHSNRRRGDYWDNGAMDIEVTVPANTSLRAGSVSGDVIVTGVQGDVRASSVSGEVTLEHIRATSVYGNSVSGDVNAQIDALTGRGDLSFRSVSGDIRLDLPKTFDADLSMSTVSGHMDTDYQLTLNGRMSNRRLEGRIGEGGRSLDISTVSGNVRLRRAN
jgi:DUF4097 and DUF4098 domain-containing protein YvlB